MLSRNAVSFLLVMISSLFLIGALEADLRAGGQGFAAGLALLALYVWVRRSRWPMLRGKALCDYGLMLGLQKKPGESERAFRRRLVESFRPFRH